MTGIPPSIWLFTRGPQSVRLVREENAKGCRLFLYGPDTEVVIHEFADVTECMKGQAEIEQNLLATGYQLFQASSDRRSEHSVWRGSDQRRSGLMISNADVEESMSDALFWSKRGEVACRIHAPDPQSDRWKIDKWCEIPGEAKRHGLAYQCPRCAPDGRLHRHLHAAEREANGIRRSA